MPGGARWEWPSPPHWHIDYLLPHAKILAIHAFKASKEWECRLSKKLAGLEGARVIMEGFGSSDCGCTSHLYYFCKKVHFCKVLTLLNSDGEKTLWEGNRPRYSLKITMEYL
jgi:Uri superfamily endonuclease